MAVLLLLLLPFFLWMLAAPRWHMLLAALYGAVAMAIGAVWLRQLRRDLHHARGQTAAQAGWRWKKSATADQFRQRLEIFLRLQGWHVLRSEVGERARVEVTARKGRACIALLCVGPGQAAAGADDLRRARDLRGTTGATQAAIVSDAGPDPLVRVADDPAIAQLRYADLARLDAAMGMSL